MLKVGETLCRVEVESTRGQEEQDALANETRPLRAEPDAPERQSAGPVRETKHFKLADIGEGITECEVVKWCRRLPLICLESVELTRSLLRSRSQAREPRRHDRRV